MKIIRRNTFETNSSSTHSITMCSGKEYDDWKNGGLYFIPDNKKFVNKDEKIIWAKKEIIENLLIYDTSLCTITYNGVSVSYDKDNWSDRHDKIKSFLTLENINAISDKEAEEYLEELSYYERPLGWQEYFDYVEYDYETFIDSYKTPTDEEVVAFGYYGYN